MESKLNLHLCANYVNEDLKSAVTNCLLCDFIIDELRLLIKKLTKEDLDLFYVHEDFKLAIEKSKDVTFATIKDWEDNKISAYTDCLRLVARLDNMATLSGNAKSGEIIEEFREKSEEFVVALSSADIDIEKIDFGQIDIKEEFVENMLHELSLVDEGQFLSDLGAMQISVAPLEIESYRNKFIEQKVKRAQKIAISVNNALEREFVKLHNNLMHSYDGLYKVAHAALSDGEKVDESIKICKVIAKHRKTLDRLEDRLTEANELKRQLQVRERRLKSDLVTRLQDFAKRIEDNPYEKDRVEREIDSLKFVTEEYLTKINLVIDFINDIEVRITERYKMIDRVENALNVAIPSESELKRYSSLSFKFEDLYVRLELAKSQLKEKDDDFKLAINSAIMGLGVLINLGVEGKDVFVRNSLLSAVFNSVNGIYDLVDNKNKSIELTQIKFVTTRLVQYSMLNKNFNSDLQIFRRICNNAIRDIAIMMGKPFTIATMLDINDSIDIAIKQIQEIVDTLNKNQSNQSQLLGDILNV